MRVGLYSVCFEGVKGEPPAGAARLPSASAALLAVRRARHMLRAVEGPCHKTAEVKHPAAVSCASLVVVYVCAYTRIIVPGKYVCVDVVLQFTGKSLCSAASGPLLALEVRASILLTCPVLLRIRTEHKRVENSRSEAVLQA